MNSQVSRTTGALLFRRATTQRRNKSDAAGLWPRASHPASQTEWVCVFMETRQPLVSFSPCGSGVWFGRPSGGPGSAANARGRLCQALWWRLACGLECLVCSGCTGECCKAHTYIIPLSRAPWSIMDRGARPSSIWALKFFKVRQREAEGHSVRPSPRQRGRRARGIEPGGSSAPLGFPA